MKSIQIDPNGKLTKLDQLKIGVDLLKEFLDLNELPYPKALRVYTSRKGKRLGSHGLYEYGPMRMSIDIPSCSVITKTPGFAWSFPGWKADMTVIGVVAHEGGHHVHGLFMKMGKEMERAISKELRRIRKEEAACTSYEPDEEESMAEGLKLFITNPDLLRVGRPMRWELFTGQMGLKPLHLLPWKTVLKYAHPTYISAAESWIKKGQAPLKPKKRNS